MRPTFPVRRLAPVAIAAVSLLTLAPGLASAQEPEPAPEVPDMPEANVVPIVGDLSISTRDSDDHSVEDGCVSPGTHLLLCFDFWTNNIGQGDFVVGSPTERPDLFVESQSHGHYHLKDFNEFALFDLAGNPVIDGAKQAFCLMDTERRGAGRHLCAPLHHQRPAGGARVHLRRQHHLHLPPDLRRLRDPAGGPAAVGRSDEGLGRVKMSA